ncbi:MAG: Ppx/GppA family phosphatase, partial [Gemmatimonadota bacterium]
IAEGFGVEEIRAVATAALREAENGPAFVEDARARFGLDIEVITPEEEAELALRSVRNNFAIDEAAAIVDIGGGSLEVVFTTAGVIDRIHSLPLGAVRLTERFVHSDPIDEADRAALREGIDREFEESIGDPPFATPDMIGSGGTFTTIAYMSMHQCCGQIGPVQGYAMTPTEFEHQVRRLREAPLALRRQMPGLNPERADIILAGATVIARLARRLEVEHILVNDRGVRDGIVLEMISRLSPVVPGGPAASDA